MKVLIVDDEMKVCQLILHLVHWEEIGLEVVGIVNDGLKAYEIIREKQPDIVITDIRMPSLDGIELVRKSLEISENIYFIIISGYSQFEYAQQAVKLGVEDYLLKPIKKKELEAVLNKIIHKHSENTQVWTEREHLRSELSQTREKVKANLLTELIFNDREEIAGYSQEMLKEEFGVSLEGRYYRMVIAHLYKNIVEENDDENKFILPKIQKSIQDKLESYCREFISIIYKEEVICLLNMEEDDDEEMLRQLKKINVDILNIQEIFPFIKVAIGVGRKMNALTEYKDSIQGIEMAILKRFGQEEQLLFWEEKGETNRINSSDIITTNFRKKLMMEMELIHADAVENSILGVEQELKAYQNDGMLMEACCREIVDIFLFSAKSYYDLEGLPTAEQLMNGYHSFYSFHKGIRWLAEECRKIVQQYEQDQKVLETKPIRMAKEYITEHYNEAITLERVSSYIGFSPTYFSSVFKKMTSQTFMEFLTEVRVNKAKMLLTDTELDIEEITGRIGYSDMKHFSKTFKKHTNLSPSEYRRLYG